MKSILICLLFILSIHYSYSFEVQEISVQELNSQIATKNPTQVVIDVRTPPELLTGIIKGAVTKNYYSFDFEQFVKALDKSKTYLIYCRSGGRSHAASQIFTKHGLKSINIKGGINAWNSLGLPTVNRKK